MRSASIDDEADKAFWVALSREQVLDLVHQKAEHCGGGRGLVGVLLGLMDSEERRDLEELTRDQRYHDRRISQSMIHGLLVLGAFASGEAHGVKKLASDLGMSTTTTWRYLKTWVAVDVLEERKDRQYQLAKRWRNGLPARPERRGTTHGQNDRATAGLHQIKRLSGWETLSDR